MASKVKDINEYPACLKVDDLSNILRISRGTAFALVKKPGFPSLRVGEKRIIIPKDEFLAWLRNQAELEMK